MSNVARLLDDLKWLTVLFLFAVSQACVLLACDPVILPPIPAPTIAPTPEPTPVPVAFDRIAVDGNRFTQRGEPFDLRGATSYWKDAGWPWSTARRAKRRGAVGMADASNLQWLASVGANWTHFRLGPFTEEAEGEGWSAYQLIQTQQPDGTWAKQYDLTVWNQRYWSELQSRLSLARSLGIHVEVDLVDAWVLKWRVSPWTFGNNINAVGIGCSDLSKPTFGSVVSYPDGSVGYKVEDSISLHPVIEAYVAKAVEETRSFDNVSYQLGNETFGCDVNPDWELAVLEVVRRLAPDRLVSTNSHHPSVEAHVDYVNYHQERAARPLSRPVVVNESGEMGRQAQLKLYREAKAMGTYWVLWRGELSEQDWDRLIAEAFGRNRGGSS